jgi:hypothetical protein
MNKKLLYILLSALSFQVLADEPINPLHFLGSYWTVESRDNSRFTELGGLSYGFRQSDLTSDPPAMDHVLAGNDCIVVSSMRTITPFIAPFMATNGACEPESSLPVVTDSGFSIVLPGGESPPLSIQDTVLPVDLSALDGQFNAFSTSVGTSGLDVADFGFERRGFTQSFFAEKSDNAQITDLAGDWAFTRLELEVEPSGNDANYTVLTFPAEITTDDGGELFVPAGVEFIESEFNHTLDGSAVEKRRFEATVDTDISISIELSPDGQLFMNNGDTGQPGRNPQVFGGFIAPSSDFLVIAEGVPGIFPFRDGDETLPDVDQFSAHQLFVGIKRNGDPDLENRQFRLVGLKYHPNAESFELASWTESAQLAFGSNLEGSWRFETEGKRAKLDNNDLAGITDFAQSETIPFQYLVEDDGRIFIDLSGVEGVEESLVNGYASPDNRVLVFSHALSLDDATHGEIGMWIALCSNCDQPQPVPALNQLSQFLMFMLLFGVGLAVARRKISG